MWLMLFENFFELIYLSSLVIVFALVKLLSSPIQLVASFFESQDTSTKTNLDAKVEVDNKEIDKKKPTAEWKAKLKEKEKLKEIEIQKSKQKPHLIKNVEESIEKSKIVSLKERISNFQEKINSNNENNKYIEPIFKKEKTKEESLIKELNQIEIDFNFRISKIKEDYDKIFKKVAPTKGRNFFFFFNFC